jgi:hypothetical protein
LKRLSVLKKPCTAFEQQSMTGVLHRCAPATARDPLSFRTLPELNFRQLDQACDHYLAKSAGEYCGPASRHLFDLVQEIKGELEPLRREEMRRNERAKYLEHIMLQWEEVFGSQCALPESVVGSSKVRTPYDMLCRLQAQQAQIEALSHQAEQAQVGLRMCQRDCRDALADREAAHRAEMAELHERHMAQLTRARECTSVVATGGLSDPAVYRGALRAECHRLLNGGEM